MKYGNPHRCVLCCYFYGLAVLSNTKYLYCYWHGSRTGVSYPITELVTLLGAVTAVFLFLYPFYLLGALGAGDIKLFMMTACYVRGEQLMCYLLVSMILAALMSIFKMILYTESRARLFYLGRYVKKVILTGVIDTYQVDKTQRKSVIRLSIPAFISLLLMCVGIY